MSNNITSITDDNFEAEVVSANVPVLIDFWAEWCGPCKMLTPILEEIAASPDYAQKVKIAKMNVDENTVTPQKFGIRGIPTLILFKDGEAAATKVGALSKSQLTAFLNEYIE